MAITTKNQKIFTYVLVGGTLTILEEYGLTAVSLLLIGGGGSYVGSKSLGAINSTPIPLSVNTPVTITAEDSKFIDGLVINGTAGNIQIIGR